jgi:nitrous oxidase accessory protein
MRVWTALLAWLAPVLCGAQLTPLQPLIDAAGSNATLTLKPGFYAGPAVIRKPLTLDGRGRVSVFGGGSGTVLRVEADGVTIKGLHITGSGESHNELHAGIQARGKFHVFKDNVIDDCLFGIDLQQGENCVIRRNRIRSKPFALGQRGDAIRLWYSFRNEITENTTERSRDTVIWYSGGNVISSNTGAHCRYSLHFMYSHENEVRHNRYVNNAVGIFLMYSDRVTLRENYIAHAAGPTGIGLGYKETSEVRSISNHVLYCASGLYIDLSPFQPETTNLFQGNLIAYNGIGARFLGASHDNVFRGNLFAGNLTQVLVSGGKAEDLNAWEGNYWSDYEGFDRDHDGRGDTPYELYAYADRLWRDVPFAQFFKGSPMLEALDLLEQLAPFSEPDLVLRDRMPVMDKPAHFGEHAAVTPQRTAW